MPSMLGGFLAVAAGELEGLGDVVLLDLLERLADQVAGCRRRGRPARRSAAWQVLGRSSTSSTPSESITTMLSIDVLQLAHVARPGVGHQRLAARRR